MPLLREVSRCFSQKRILPFQIGNPFACCLRGGWRDPLLLGHAVGVPVDGPMVLPFHPVPEGAVGDPQLDRHLFHGMPRVDQGHRFPLEFV
jgi:hypothetical protein